VGQPDETGRLISNQGRVLNRFSVARTVAACARIAGIGHVHPHQLRHTLATQSISNGMSLETVSAMLGHRSMRMTLVYARIADRTVADEYFAAADKVDQLYTTHLTRERSQIGLIAAQSHRFLDVRHQPVQTVHLARLRPSGASPRHVTQLPIGPRDRQRDQRRGPMA
jgi:Phage integrase family